jgi:(S)-ureidoglycine aminohydrolase
MKVFLVLISTLVTLSATAQTDSLVSGVYPISSGKIKGSTTDLASLRAHASTLAPGKTNHPARALMDAEELIFVKEGLLDVTINDSTKTLGPGSIVLIMAGDVQGFRNTSDKPVSYYVLTFKSSKAVNTARGKAAGGSLLIDWNNLAVKKTEKGESRAIFNRPTSMFAKFEIHATALNGGQDSHAPHQHREEEIMLLMKGSATAHIGDKDYSVSPGDIVFVRPNILHNVKNPGTEQCWYYAFKWVNE